MRVVVEVVSGPSGSKRFVLGANQGLRIGRTEQADLSFPRDGRMSGLHFSLQTDFQACYIEDLRSSNGTAVNGQPISQRLQLRNGDRVVAGDTQFLVRLETDVHEQVAAPAGELSGWGGPIPSQPPPPPAKDPRGSEFGLVPGLRVVPNRGVIPHLGSDAAVAKASAVRMPKKVPYTVETCDSKLTLCRGDSSDLAPAEVAVWLSRLYPVHLIVDFRRLGAPPPESAAPQYLFNWLNPAAVPLVSPALISQTEFLNWPALVAQGWGNDAVICLFSRQDQATLLEHLRSSCKARSGPSASVLGICWPSVLAPLLSSSSPSLVGKLLAGIDAVLIELADLPETWQIYGSQRIVEDLGQIGFVERT